ncbi:MAG: hypothetical protein HYY16_16165 [Planctomycetes bacterium]|nr:hypothetical protein [Planctomycetota bacterium]
MVLRPFAFVAVCALLQQSGLSSVKQLPDKPRPFRSRMHASPDWRDQSIYFVMTDRFFDGDPANNQRGYSTFEKANPHGAHGGDFRGLIRKLDYIKGLGATAIWVTPVLQNYEAYHGYATCNFLEIEPRLGGLKDLREFVAEAHARGMYVILDVVVNHQADLIYPKDGTTGYREEGREQDWYHRGRKERVMPLPVEFQDLRLFHNHGDIDRWDDYGATPCHTETGDFRGLDDFKTELPEVRDAMVRIYRYLIAQTDVDGFRVDTAKHVNSEFWQAWCPAIHEYAASIGKRQFFLFGEFWHGDDARVGACTGTRGGGKFLFDGMLHFPMWNTFKEVFREGMEPEAITRRMQFAKEYHDDLLNVLFFDNHDMPRFLNGMGTDGWARLKAALGFLYTARGIPCLYYGTEQGFSGGEDPWNREDMCGANGDHFNPRHELYEWVAKLNKLRREAEPLRRGEFVARWGESAGPGVYAFSRVTPTEEILVAFNTSGETRTATNVPLERKLSPPGAILVDALGSKEAVQVDAGRAQVDLTLPAYGVRVYRRR